MSENQFHHRSIHFLQNPDSASASVRCLIFGLVSLALISKNYYYSGYCKTLLDTLAASYLSQSTTKVMHIAHLSNDKFTI